MTDVSFSIQGRTMESVCMQGKVVWEGPVEEFDSTDEPIVRQFASGSLQGPIRYE